MAAVELTAKSLLERWSGLRSATRALASPLKEQSRIFDAFHRLQQSDKTAEEGTGLGLAITRRLVELHGGQLGIESQMGAGSCFYFTLPMVPSSSTGSTLDQSMPMQRCWQLRQESLLSKTTSAAAQLLESQLASVGYEAIICSNIRGERWSWLPNYNPAAAITLDIAMKPISGWEILSSLKSDPRTANIPVIVVTVIDQQDAGALLGADEYVVKPVDRAIFFCTAINRCLNHGGQIHEANPRFLSLRTMRPRASLIARMLSRMMGMQGLLLSNGTQARLHVQASPPSPHYSRPDPCLR